MPVTVELILRVSRGEDNRLSGTVHTRHGGAAHRFSGTLELMRVFEELVLVDPTESSVKSAGRGVGTPAVPGLAEPRTARTDYEPHQRRD